MRSRGDAEDPARALDEPEDPGRLMHWLRLAADVVDRGPVKRGGGKKGGERVDVDDVDKEGERKAATPI